MLTLRIFDTSIEADSRELKRMIAPSDRYTKGMIGAATARTAPDLMEAIIGYRSWRVSHGVLQSPMASGNWIPGVNRAECGFRNFRSSLYRRHAAPGHKCGCGLYAFYSPKEIFSGDPYATCPKPLDVLGAVKMWGKIELHSTGLRAEFAEPIALYAPKLPIAHPLIQALSGGAALAALRYAYHHVPPPGATHTTRRILTTAIGCAPAAALNFLLQYRRQRLRQVADRYGIPLVGSLGELQTIATACGAIITDASAIGE